MVTSGSTLSANVSAFPNAPKRIKRVVFTAKDFDELGGRIDQPVLARAMPLVETKLHTVIAQRGRWRQHLDHQIGRAVPVVIRAELAQAVLAAHPEHVGLQHVAVIEIHVHRRDDHFAFWKPF